MLQFHAFGKCFQSLEPLIATTQPSLFVFSQL